MPEHDFISFDPDFSEAQRDECEQIIQRLRELNVKAMRLEGSIEELSDMNVQLEQVSQAMDAVSQRRAIRTYNSDFNLRQPNDTIPFNINTIDA